MAKKRHHYVPQFYLRRFASRPRRVNIFNLARGLPIKDVSLKDQCRRPNFYGTQDAERALSALEGDSARCLAGLAAQPTHKPTQTLLEFVAVQYLRTPSIARLFDTASKKLFSLTTARMSPSKRKEFYDDVMGLNELPAFGLTLKGHVVERISDLKLLIVTHDESVFITSDNPVFFYNQYCEQIQGRGKNGAGQRGLQIFVPLSPKQFLILYDGNTYEHAKKQIVSESDIKTLNEVQVISAETNLFFSDWNRTEEVQDTAARSAHRRMADPTVVEQFASDDGYGSLRHLYIETPNVELDLSFLRIKKRALRVPLTKRLTTRKPEYSISYPIPNIKCPLRFSKRTNKL